MYQKKIIYFIIGLMSCFITPISAQDDFGSIISFDVTKKIVKKLNVTFEEEFRTRSNFNVTDRFAHTLELNYKPLEYLKVGAAYNLIQFNHVKRDWELRHRHYFYATGSMEAGRFSFSLRERFQSTKRQGVKETATRANPKLYLRSRLKVDYNIRNCKFDPFVSVELFNTLNDPRENKIDRWRGVAGVEYKPNKKSAFQVYYRYTNYIDEEDSNNHLFGAGYSFKF